MTYIIGEGGESDRRALRLATLKNTFIRNVRYDEAAPEQLREALRMDKDNHPFITFRSISNVYNCAGLVFAARRTHIDIDDIDPILEDDGYRRLPGVDDAMPGDVVIYQRNQTRTHVGIYLRREVVSLGDARHLVLSKWGSHGEYIHTLNDVPERYGSAAEFWTERRGMP